MKIRIGWHDFFQKLLWKLEALKQKQVEEEQEDDKDWWKNPVLQGEDNDYGQYDYLLNPLPQGGTTFWIDLGDTCKCDMCNKYRHLYYYTEGFFYCWDGYDSAVDVECLSCAIKQNIKEIKHIFRFMAKHLQAWMAYIKYNKIKAEMISIQYPKDKYPAVHGGHKLRNEKDYIKVLYAESTGRTLKDRVYRFYNGEHSMWDDEETRTILLKLSNEKLRAMQKNI